MKFTILEALKGAKAQRRDWREIADIIISTLEGIEAKDRFGQISSLYKEAEKQSGYSSSMLRRMVTVRYFTLEKEEEIPGISLTGSTPLAFPILEIFQRFYKSNPDKALKIWPALKKGNISLSDMKKIYLERATPLKKAIMPKQDRLYGGPSSNDFVSHGRAALSAFRRSAAEAVAANLGLLCDEETVELVPDYYEFDYAHADAVAVYMPGPNVKWADGFDFRLNANMPTKRRRKQMYAEIALSAAHFRRYWIILPSDTRSISLLREAIEDLGLSWVGIATFDLNDPRHMSIELEAAKRTPEGHVNEALIDEALTKITRTGIPL